MPGTTNDGDRVLRNVARVDFGTVRNIERTPIGGLRIDAAITRSGVLVYRDTNGTEFREFVPPDEVFNADSLATMRDIPVTDGHPSALVTPASYRSVSRGHVADNARQDGSLACAPLVIDDAALCAAVESHERKDVSAGYTCDIDPTPGTFEGESYDRVQRNRRYNHVAVLPPGAGRAGPEVSLRMDGAAVQVRADGARERDHVNVKPITFRGREYKFDEAAGNFGTLEKDAGAADAEMGKAKADGDAMQAAFDAVRASLIAAVQKIAALEAQVQMSAAGEPDGDEADVEPEPEEVLDSRAARRVIAHVVAPGAKLNGMRADAVRSLVSTSIDKLAATRAEEIAKVRMDAAKVLAEAEIKGKGVDEIRRAVLSKLSPEVKLDAVDSKTLALVCDAALSAAKPAPATRRDAGNAAIRKVLETPRTDAEDTSLEALYAAQTNDYLARGRAANGSK